MLGWWIFHPNDVKFVVWRGLWNHDQRVLLGQQSAAFLLALARIGRLPSSSSQLKASLDTCTSLFLGRIPALLSRSVAVTERPTNFSSWNKASPHWTSPTLGGPSAKRLWGPTAVPAEGDKAVSSAWFTASMGWIRINKLYTCWSLIHF